MWRHNFLFYSILFKESGIYHTYFQPTFLIDIFHYRKNISGYQKIKKMQVISRSGRTSASNG